MIPTVAECFQLMDRYRMLDNIRDHSIIVARVSALIAGECREAGLDISMPLVVTAALLHDIGKTACLDNGRDHAELGRDICLEHGFDELAPIVADHVFYRNGQLPQVGENEIVCYADKRVNHELVVSLEERESYIVERYGNGEPERLSAIRENCRRWREIEKALFAVLPIATGDIGDLIDPDPATCDMRLENLPDAPKPSSFCNADN